MSSLSLLLGSSLLCHIAFHPAAAQEFSAESAVGTGPGTRMGDPNTDNAAADEMADPADPDAILERQGFDAVRVFSRTCPCVPRSDSELVRPPPAPCPCFELPSGSSSFCLPLHRCSVRYIPGESCTCRLQNARHMISRRLDYLLLQHVSHCNYIHTFADGFLEAARCPASVL